MSFNSALILIISFLLLALGFVCCCSSSSNRCRVRLFTWDFSIFFREACIAMNFPIRTAFTVSQRFGVVVSSFSFVSRNFSISSLISFWTHCLIACYSVYMSLSVFEVFPWGWFLVLVPCGQRKCLIWFQFSWICWGLFCVLSCGLSLNMFHVYLKRMCILLLWDERLSLYIS